MSTECVGWTMRRSPHTGTALLVHLAVADIVNASHDYLLYASTARIAAVARCEPDTARRALVQLVDTGCLELVEDNSARHRSSKYRFLMPDTGFEAYPSPRSRSDVRSDRSDISSDRSDISSDPTRTRREREENAGARTGVDPADAAGTFRANAPPSAYTPEAHPDPDTMKANAARAAALRADLKEKKQ